MGWDAMLVEMGRSGGGEMVLMERLFAFIVGHCEGRGMDRRLDSWEMRIR